jgi:gamma-glutamyltranspeptidase/glutathione hydrolase
MTKTEFGGAVVSENKLASEIGTRILAAGGSACDAIIATIIAVNTTSPYHSDLGGGGFGLIQTPRGNFESINFRHTAPVSLAAVGLSVNATSKRPRQSITSMPRPLSGDRLSLFRGR